MVRPSPLPDEALLARYRAGDGGRSYTDCYSTSIEGDCSLAEFVFAFYTTWLFRMERVILRVLARRPSSDADARLVAEGGSETFAAWSVEDRSASQLLMCDMHSRTRSWFMVESESRLGPPATRLRFGSAVVPVRNAQSDESKQGFLFSLLMPLHKLYSRALLALAARKLRRR